MLKTGALTIITIFTLLIGLATSSLAGEVKTVEVLKNTTVV